MARSFYIDDRTKGGFTVVEVEHVMLCVLVGGTYSVAYIQPLGHGHPEPIRWEYVRDCTGRNVEPLRCT